MMSLHISIVRARLAAALLVAGPALALAAPATWQLVTSEQGKRVEIDRASIVTDSNGDTIARGRIVFDKAIVDPKTSVSYRTIEVVNRFDCHDRTHATLKRAYYKDDGELLRQEEMRNAFDMPVRSGTPDDRLLREVCRPNRGDARLADANKVVEKVDSASSDLRKLNEALIEKEVRRDLQRLNSSAQGMLGGKNPAKPTPPAARSQRWDYAGDGAPENWAKLKPEYASCDAGRRQAPIDLRNGIPLDLASVDFTYRPAPFRVSDVGRSLQLTVYGGGFALLGKTYELARVEFHRPAETTIAGKRYAMDAQLVHKAADGKLAIVAILFEQGSENRVVQQALNNVPLEAGGEVAPPAQAIDLGLLLPANRAYYTFMGSLTTPPCTEDVLWLVLKEPQQISAEQLAIFARLYPPNARPLQPVFDRIIKESR
jgi:carbonic anhydrase